MLRWRSIRYVLSHNSQSEEEFGDGENEEES